MEKAINKVYLPVFTGMQVNQYTQNALLHIKDFIEKESTACILKASETEYIEFLIHNSLVEVPKVNFDVDKVRSESEEYRQENSDIFAEPDLLFIYHLPFVGDYRILHWQPNLIEENNTNKDPQVIYNPYPSLVTDVKQTKMNVYVMVYKYYEEDRYSYYGETKIELNRNSLENKIAKLERPLHLQELTPTEREDRRRELEEALEYLDQLSELYIHIEIKSSKIRQREIEADIRAFLKEFKRNVQKLAQDVEKHNARVKKSAKEFFHSRRQRLLNQLGILQSIGYPLKKRNDVPDTFTIPTEHVRRQIRVIKPMVFEDDQYIPEPTLHESIYNDILKTMYDLGKMIERKPTVYRDKAEQSLRDLFLIYLEPRYDGAATGETFNGGGRTDILIRYQNSNVFVSECKIWHGAKNYLEGITQLLHNVVWRDSKAAIVLFVKSEPLTYICEKVKETTPQHSNYLGIVDENKETWFNYRFHINGDRNKEVKLAVLIFWVPQDKTVAENITISTSETSAI